MVDIITKPVTSTEFSVIYDPPRSTSAGFVCEMQVSFNDYGMDEGQDYPQWDLRCRCRGREKRVNGKPDMRSRARALLLVSRFEQLELIVDALKDVSDRLLREVFEFASNELDIAKEEQEARLESVREFAQQVTQNRTS